MRFNLSIDPFTLPNATGRTPNPFPGKFPTRWYVRLARPRRGQGKEFVYVGKPNVTVGAKFIRELQKRTYADVHFIEFDKGCRLRSILNPYANNFEHEPLNYVLGGRYYPWGSFVGVHDLAVKQHSKLIRYLDSRFTVYSPHERLSVRNHIEPFKLWLRTNGVTR